MNKTAFIIMGKPSSGKTRTAEAIRNILITSGKPEDSIALLNDEEICLKEIMGETIKGERLLFETVSGDDDDVYSALSFDVMEEAIRANNGKTLIIDGIPLDDRQALLLKIILDELSYQVHIIYLDTDWKKGLKNTELEKHEFFHFTLPLIQLLEEIYQNTFHTVNNNNLEPLIKNLL